MARMRPKGKLAALHSHFMAGCKQAVRPRGMAIALLPTHWANVAKALDKKLSNACFCAKFNVTTGHTLIMVRLTKQGQDNNLPDNAVKSWEDAVLAR